jgi:hypothetical protein
MDAITTGDTNTAMGYGAAGSLTGGARNVAIGYAALSAGAENGLNVAIGYEALKVQNTGNANATVNIWCYVGDNLTETTLLTTTIIAGEPAKELPVSWWANSDGPQILNCRALIPDVLKAIAGDVTNVEGGNSQEVGWYIGEETEDKPLIVYGLLVVLIIIGSALFARKAGEKISTIEFTEPLEEVDDEVED